MVADAKRLTKEEIHKRAPWLIKPGETRNPGGRPKRQTHIVALAREYTESAILTLVYIMTRSRASDAEKRSCAIELLNRGWGATPRSLAIFGDLGGGMSGALPAATPGQYLSMDSKVNILMAVAERGPDALLEFADELPPAPRASADTIDLVTGEPIEAETVTVDLVG